jgi:hypothetical protein
VILVVRPGSGLFVHSGSRRQGSRRYRIANPDPQHWIHQKKFFIFVGVYKEKLSNFLRVRFPQEINPHLYRTSRTGAEDLLVSSTGTGRFLKLLYVKRMSRYQYCTQIEYGSWFWIWIRRNQYLLIRVAGSGSRPRIRCLCDPWIRDPDLGWTTRIMFPKDYKQFIGVKILKLFYADPGSMIRDE